MTDLIRKSLEQIPDVIYHYTSVETLLKIYSNDSLWLTNLKFLNDSRERSFYLSEIKKRITCKLNMGPRDFALSELHAISEDPHFVDLPFIASFSTDPDSLPQWRSYCGSGNGVAIGFRKDALEGITISHSEINIGDKTHTIETPVSLERVRYLTESDDEHFSEEIQDALSLAALDRADYDKDFDPETDSYVPTMETFFTSRIESVAALVKHSKFASEQEIRLLIGPLFMSQFQIKYRPSRSTMVPYIEGKLNRPTAFLPRTKVVNHMTPNPHFIAEVVVGPSANSNLTKEAIIGLFSTAGYYVDVRPSQISFRDWL